MHASLLDCTSLSFTTYLIDAYYSTSYPILLRPLPTIQNWKGLHNQVHRLQVPAWCPSLATLPWKKKKALIPPSPHFHNDPMSRGRCSIYLAPRLVLPITTIPVPFRTELPKTVAGTAHPTARSSLPANSGCSGALRWASIRYIVKLNIWMNEWMNECQNGNLYVRKYHTRTVTARLSRGCKRRNTLRVPHTRFQRPSFWGLVDYVAGGGLDIFFYEIYCTEKSRLHLTLQSCDRLALYRRSYACSSKRWLLAINISLLVSRGFCLLFSILLVLFSKKNHAS